MIKLFQINDPHLASVAPPSRLDEDYRGTILKKIETALQKAEAVNANAVVFTGDIFHNKHGRMVPHGLVGEVSDLLLSYSIPKYGIAGNHDIIWDDPASIPTQPIGNLFRTKALGRLSTKEPVIFTDQEGMTVELYGLDYDPKTVLDPKSYNVGFRAQNKARIIVCHAPFYRPSFQIFGKGIYLDDLVDSSVDVILCGHVHSDEVGILQSSIGENPKVLVNLGALSRGTSHVYNFQRKVQVAELQFEVSTQFNYKLNVVAHEVGARPAEEVLSTTTTDQPSPGISAAEFLEELREAGAADMTFDPDTIITAYLTKLNESVAALTRKYIEMGRNNDQQEAS